MIGQTISHYRILEKLGEGGMGVVYKAHDTKLDRVVALKFLPQYLSSDTAEKERFYHEARAASALLHANVAVIFEVNEHEGRLFLAMEYVEGQTLKKLIEEGDPFSLKKVLDIAIQSCDGLVAAHEKGIVHRDIKSDNIMMTPKGQVKVMDFGLAKVKGSTKLTRAGSTLGTAAYMSPEQAQGDEVDHRSDIFSFGVVVYELLTGRLPFRGEHQAALMYSLMNEEPAPVARFNENVTPEIEQIVLKALAKEKGERYQHVDDMLADLRRVRKGLEYGRTGYVRTSSVAAARQEEFQPRRRYLRYIVIGTVAVVVAIFLVIFNPFNFEINTKKSVAGENRRSIAVLPFKNLGDDKGDEYFSDGITEDIITQLSKIHELKVRARTAVMKYKNSQKDLRDIANELVVATILEGSVRRSGEKVRITSELVDAHTNDQIWAETYDRDLKDVFAIQSDVAQKIAAALQTTLTASEKERIEKKPTQNLDAYAYYLKGREYYYRYHRKDNENAIELYKKALELDPNYALAYAGLGDSYGQRTIKFGFPVEWADSAIAASQTAISIDPNLAEAYKALGLGYGAKGFVRRGLEAYLKAVQLNPNYHPAVGNVSFNNYFLGNYVEATRWARKDYALTTTEPFTYLELGVIYGALTDDVRAEQLFKRAVEIQPDFIFAPAALAKLYLEQGNTQKAIEVATKNLTTEPDNVIALNTVGCAELFAGNFARAQEYFEKAREHSRRIYDLTYKSNEAGLGFALLKSGRKNEAEALFNESLALRMTELDKGNELPVIRYDIAAVKAAQGKNDEAYHWLQKAIDAGWRNYRYAMKDPMFERLHNDVQFQRLMTDVQTKVDEMRKQAEAEEGKP